MRDQCWATTPLQPCGRRRRRWHPSKSSAPSPIWRRSQRFVIDKAALSQMISRQCSRSNGACCTTCGASRCSRMCRENAFSRIVAHNMEHNRGNHPVLRLLKNYHDTTICRVVANLIDYRLCTQGTFSAVSKRVVSTDEGAETTETRQAAICPAMGI